MHHVLLAVDGSEASEQAACLLARIPHPHRFDVTIARIVELPVLPNPLRSAELVDKVYRQEKFAAAQALTRISAMFEGAQVHVNNIIDRGPVGERLVQISEEIGADLVVVGATGRSQISRILLGSVSDYVATHARCSVLVVRPAGWCVPDKPLQVCLAYEGRSQRALQEISEVSWRGGARFHVLSVVPFSDSLFGAPRDHAEVVQSYKAGLEKARLQLAPMAPAVKLHLAESEHIGESIVQFAEREDVDLMVVGETAREDFTRLLLGSTARYVLRHAPCSVWISRQGEPEPVRESSAQTQANQAQGSLVR